MNAKKALGIALLAVAAAATSGCATNKATANLVAGADLSKVHSIYVAKEEGDDHDVDKLIVTYLTKRGFQVTSGPEHKPPYEADAVVTYADKWFWDITMYMLQLQVTMRDKSAFPMAQSLSLHTSLTRKSPTEMVDEAVGNLLAAK
jgi:hypothetical protein